MLRRPPTTLSITAEDVAAYEDRRASETLLAAQQARAEAEARARAEAAEATAAAAGRGASNTASMEGVQSSPSASRRAARDERIGVGRRGGR
jgi:septal ring factor EnvC (AmiA/AmiB activator)